jgi:DNA-binding NarL/FixJ family response regulator
MVDVKKLRILIADDSEDLRELLRELVGQLRYAEVILEADSAGGAIDFVKNYDVDVAILDIQMPGNGINALKEIKAESPDVRIVMLTNHADSFYKRICLRAGADYFLDKTMEIQLLPEVLCDMAHCEEE